LSLVSIAFCIALVSWLKQRSVNSTACIISNTQKFDQSLMHVRHDTFTDCICQNVSRSSYVCYKRLHKMGPLCLSDMCQSISSVAGCRHLHSAVHTSLQTNDCWQKGIFFRLSAWNCLPAYPKDRTSFLTHLSVH